MSKNFAESNKGLLTVNLDTHAGPGKSSATMTVKMSQYPACAVARAGRDRDRDTRRPESLACTKRRNMRGPHVFGRASQ